MALRRTAAKCLSCSSSFIDFLGPSSENASQYFRLYGPSLLSSDDVTSSSTTMACSDRRPLSRHMPWLSAVLELELLLRAVWSGCRDIWMANWSSSSELFSSPLTISTGSEADTPEDSGTMALEQVPHCGTALRYAETSNRQWLIQAQMSSRQRMPITQKVLSVVLWQLPEPWFRAFSTMLKK